MTIHESFLCENLGAWHLLVQQKREIYENFLHKNLFFTNLQKFSPLKVFRDIVALPLPIISLTSYLRLKMGEQKNVPLKDRQMALALILELALQRGTLQQILEAVLLLLRLSGSTCRYYHSNQMQLKCEGEETLKKPPEYGKGPPECGNLPPSNEDQRCYPLIPFLRRIGDIPTPETPYLGFQRVDTVSACLCVLVSLAVGHLYT